MHTLLSISVLCIVGTAVYALAGIATALGIFRLPRSRRVSDAALPAVSVIVSARNEARDLPACLTALAALDYPRDKLEILLVDDRSTDRTAAIMAEACARYPHFRQLSSADSDTRLEAKARGVAHAARHARGEWLFITDADAVVHPNWLRAMLGRAEPGVGMLGGLYVTAPVSVIGVLERATGIAAHSISFGVEGLGGECVPVGPNMAIRRDIYEAHGGLDQVEFRIAEDIALWQLCQRAQQRVAAVLEPEATVTVQPVPSLTHLISQQRRWLLGGLGDGPAHLRRAALWVSIWALVSTTSVLVLCAMGEWTGVVGLGGIALSQIAGMTALRQRLRLAWTWRIVPVAVVYTTLLFVWLPLTAFLLPRVLWRGDGYEVRFST